MFLLVLEHLSKSLLVIILKFPTVANLMIYSTKHKGHIVSIDTTSHFSIAGEHYHTFFRWLKVPDNTTDLKLAATHSKDWNAKYINKNVSMVILGGLFFELELQIIQCFIYSYI